MQIDYFGIVLIIAGVIAIVFSRKNAKGQAKHQRRMVAMIFRKSLREVKESSLSLSESYYRVSQILVGIVFIVIGVLRNIRLDLFIS